VDILHLLNKVSDLNADLWTRRRFVEDSALYYKDSPQVDYLKLSTVRSNNIFLSPCSLLRVLPVALKLVALVSFQLQRV